MHDQYRSGWSCLRIAHYLNSHAVPTRRGGPWSDGLIWNMLRSPYQAGARSTDEGLRSGGNVAPLLSVEEYEYTLALMKTRTRRRGRIGKHAIPARLVRCGNCGGPLVSGSQGQSGNLLGVYECLHRKQGSCDRGVSIRYTKLEEYVEKRLFAHLRGSRGSRPATRQENALAPVLEELERVRASLGRLAVMRAEGQIGEEEFVSARELQRKRQSKLETQFERISRRLEGDVKSNLLDETWEDLGQLTAETWKALSLQARRDIIELVIEQIVLDPAVGHDASHMAASKRVRIRWR